MVKKKYLKLENIKDKNEELHIVQPIKLVRVLKMRVSIIMTTFAFYDFYRVFKKFKRMPLGSKYDVINDFYMLLLIHTKHPILKQKIVKKEL